jgi:hypothetical protein
MQISYSGNGKQDASLGNQVTAEHKVPRDIDIFNARDILRHAYATYLGTYLIEVDGK